MNVIVTVVSRASLILANCLAIGATWFTLRRDHGFSYVRESGRKTLAGVLLWDGERPPRTFSDVYTADGYETGFIYFM